MPPTEGALPHFRQLSDEVVQRGWAVTFNRATFEGPGGEVFERFVVRHPGAVAVVAIDASDQVLLVHQYRPAVDRWVLELPAGTRDVDGEEPELTARRELAEEAGVGAASWELLTECVITPGFCDEFSWIYLATDLSTVATDRQGTEEHHMAVVPVPLAEFDEWVDRGEIIDASTMLGVALARRRTAR